MASATKSNAAPPLPYGQPAAIVPRFFLLSSATFSNSPALWKRHRAWSYSTARSTANRRSMSPSLV